MKRTPEVIQEVRSYEGCIVNHYSVITINLNKIMKCYQGNAGHIHILLQ